MFRTVLVLALLMSLSSCVKYEKRMAYAHRAFAHSDFKTSMRHLQLPAHKGQPDAQYAIGYMYYYGLGVTEDRAAAKRWFSASAAQGYPDAIRALKMIKEKMHKQTKRYTKSTA